MTVKRPNSAPIASAPAMPPAKPRSTLFVSCAASTDVIAAVSIIPSRPRLRMPERSATSSPSTASRRGVAATSAMRIASIMRTLPQAPAPEENEGEDDGGLAERRHRRGDAGRPLQLSGARRQRAEEERRAERRQGMELREQRHGDAGVAVAGGEALEETMRHAEELDASAETGPSAGDGHRARDLCGDVHSRPERGIGVEAGGAEPQSLDRAIEEQPRRHARGYGQQRAGVQLPIAEQRQRRRRDVALRILPGSFAQRSVHKPAEEMNADEVQQDGRQNSGGVA